MSNPTKIRAQVIQQLRHALSLVESPGEDDVEFDILDTTFSFDFSFDSPEENEPETH